MKESIQMVDLYGQYQHIKQDVDDAILQVIESSAYIKGPAVKKFENNLGSYLNAGTVISCANGTDALQIALMALNLKRGDEVIVPAFTYVATAEVIGLLGLVPVLVDVDAKTFNLTADLIRPVISERTKVIIPVHLFGQCTDMEDILILARQHNIYVIEDNAQALGAVYTFSNGDRKHAGTLGNIGCTSFFPSKNLGCYGDGGALFSNDQELVAQIKMIANHGQIRKYYHEVLGVNSRLDTIQAAILDIKLKYLDNYITARQHVASVYDEQLNSIPEICIPYRATNSTHVFHQYTIHVLDGRRDELQEYLKENGIPSMIYYPLPLYQQRAFKDIIKKAENIWVADILCEQVLSLPIHTEMDNGTQNYIVDTLHSFFSK